MNSAPDEDRWAEARSLLDRAPTEPAEQRIRRWQRQMALLIVGIVVLGLAFTAAAVAWFDDADVGGSTDAPPWRETGGLVVSAVAVVVLVWAVVVQWRGNRRRKAWRSPLVPLTQGQRKELWARVRDDDEVPPDRLPLARHLAESVAGQRILLVLGIGIVLMWTGQLIAAPSAWRLGLVVGYAAVNAVGLPWILRNERRARRFLADHPAPDDDSAA